MVLPNAPAILPKYKSPFIWFSEHGITQFPFKINNLAFFFKINDLTPKYTFLIFDNFLI